MKKRILLEIMKDRETSDGDNSTENSIIVNSVTFDAGMYYILFFCLSLTIYLTYAQQT